MESDKNTTFYPILGVTHNCNLNCLYCYQKHDTEHRMTFETAKTCIDWCFANKPKDCEGIEFDFIGGEPLLEFNLIRKVVEYTLSKPHKEKLIFYATTNGTILTDEMRKWFSENKDIFVLGLSLDGTPDVHNHNRCNSFEKIDIDFFLKTWPFQGIKMTLTEYSLKHLAESIKYLHSLGIEDIGGVNLFEGNFPWDDEKFVKILIPQLNELVDFYVENDELKLNQMLDRNIQYCEAKEKRKSKWCGIGTGTIYFDTDGTRYPCQFATSMTFNENDLNKFCSQDFTKDEDFVDDYCYNNCYIYPVCNHCASANFLTQKTFKVQDKSKCRIQKLVTLYSAEIQARRLVKNPDRYDEKTKYNLINAIKKIKTLLLPEFSEYFENSNSVLKNE